MSVPRATTNAPYGRETVVAGVPSPPPLPDRDHIARSSRNWRSIVWLGAILTASPLWGVIPGLMQTFGSMDGDIAQAASTITGGVAAAMIGALTGFAICPIGILLLVLALRRLGPLQQQLAMLDTSEKAAPQSHT